MKLLVFKKLKYYINLWIKIFKLSLSRASTYRVEFFTRFLRGVFLVVIQLIYVHAILGEGTSFLGWGTDDMYLLLGVYNTINYLSWSIFSINLWRLEEKILRGEFDFLLLRPHSSLFAASFNEFFIDDAISGLSGIFLIGFYFVYNLSELSLSKILFGLIASFCAFLIWYSLETIFASFDFVSIKNGLREIKRSLTNVARFPFEIWNPSFRIIFYTIFPIAFVSAIPAGLITGLYDYKYLLCALAIAISFLLFSRFIWYKAIKKYTSMGG